MRTCKKIVVVTTLFLLAFQAISQDTAKVTAVKKAFEASYTFEKTANFTTAITKIKSVYDATSYEINLRLGYLCYEGLLYRESAKYYKKAVELKPSSIEAKLGFALPLYALASWDTLKMQYEAILKLDPNNSTVNYRMGLTYYYKLDYTTALTYFQKVYDSYPFDYDNTCMMGWTMLKLKKTTEAKSYFNIVLLIRPNDTSALSGMKELK
jgi:tetratricopeptide (TPR) repeat protein